MKMRIIKFLIVICFITFCACQKNQPIIIPPKAEITNIYNITDSTAQVDVQVTSQSNAQVDDDFGLIIDSISLNGNKIQVSIENFNVERRLINSYSTKISNLKSKTQYYVYLYYGGEFNIGDTYEMEFFDIGSPKIFTTN